MSNIVGFCNREELQGIRYKSKNNCFMICIFQLIISIEELMKDIAKIDRVVIAKKNNRVWDELLDIFSKIQDYNIDDSEAKYINLDAFRSILGSEYNHTFPYNEPGDADSFFNFITNALFNIFEYQSKYLEESDESPMINAKQMFNGINKTLAKTTLLDKNEDSHFNPQNLEESCEDSCVQVISNPINKCFLGKYLSTIYYSETGESNSLK